MELKGTELDKQIRIATLENAAKFNGKASQGAVIGKLFSLDPLLKSRMKEVAPVISKIIAEINALSKEQQEKELKSLVPDFAEKEKAKKEQRKKERSELPSLKGAVNGKVVTRMPPGPSKYPHIGHAISFGINYLYAKMYEGTSILRFDDTNPEVEKQEFVDEIKKGVIDYLGFVPDKEIFASDYIDEMYRLTEKLIEKNEVYACNCSSETISKQRRSMQECKHRNQTKEKTKQLWDKMKKGTVKDYALRLKIDMKHKNAVMRDPVIFRYIATSHYRKKTAYKMWPMYDFESPIMDGILGITHVLRSNEFDTRIELHHHIAKLFGFLEIPYKHYGRSAITGALTQGRVIREKIEKKEFIGWDDPRLVTLKALERRGIVKDAIIAVVKRAGLSKTNTNIDFDVLATENRKILDETAQRFFFIKKPKKISILDAPELDSELDLHPDNAHGGRHLPSKTEFYIETDDYKLINDSSITRLMDCLNFTKKGNNFVYHSTSYSNVKTNNPRIIHWLPADKDFEKKLVHVKIFMPNAKFIEGLAEPATKHINIGDVIQFERFGFCRLDKKTKQDLVFWFTHN